MRRPIRDISKKAPREWPPTLRNGIGMIFRYFSWGFLLQRQLVKDSSASLSPSRRGAKVYMWRSWQKYWIPSRKPFIPQHWRKEPRIFRSTCWRGYLIFVGGFLISYLPKHFWILLKKSFLLKKFVSTRLRMDAFFRHFFWGSSCHGLQGHLRHPFRGTLLGWSPQWDRWGRRVPMMFPMGCITTSPERQNFYFCWCWRIRRARLEIVKLWCVFFWWCQMWKLNTQNRCRTWTCCGFWKWWGHLKENARKTPYFVIFRV